MPTAPQAAAPAAEECGTGTAAALQQQGDANATRTGSVETKPLANEKCDPIAPPAAASDSTTGSATSVGLLSTTGIVNSQTGGIAAPTGTGSGSLTNTATSTVTQAGAANAGTGEATQGTTQGSAPAAALGASTRNLVTDVSNIVVTVAGSNDAPIKATSQHETTVTDIGVAGATSGATAPSPVTPATPVTSGSANAGVTPPAAVTPASSGQAASATPADATPASGSCAGHEAATTVEGKAEETIAGPTASGQPILIQLGQQAKVTNDGATGGTPRAAAQPNASGAGATSGELQTTAAPQPGAAPRAASPSGTAGASGLEANNNVRNTGVAEVTIGGNNYAPITVAIRTVTHIVNAALGVAETAAGAPAGGETTGLGARVTNDVNLDSAAAVDVAGDNHSPIKIVLELTAELWNTGRALLGLAGGGAAQTAAEGLQVDNLLSLLGRASVRIGGDNYAPIDIEILLHNLIYNEGIAQAVAVADSPRQAGSGAAASAIDTARRLSSGPANCLSLVGSTAVANAQAASVRMPVNNGIAREVLAGNTHVVDVQGRGAATCTTGDAHGGTSGDVVVGPATTVLTVVTTQTADTSAKTGASEEEPTDPGTTPGTTPDATPGTNPGTAPGHTTDPGGKPVKVVVAVTKKPVVKQGKVSTRSKKIVRNEEQWEWVIEWVPLYVIYPDEEEPPVQMLPEIETETTTSMAGSFVMPEEPRPAALVRDAGGLDLVTQLQLALLGIVAFLLLAILKRRLNAIHARKNTVAPLSAPQLVVLPGGGAGAAA